MAITSLKTKLSLQEWADNIGINPVLFNNLDLTNCIPDYQLQGMCDDFWSHWQYQKSSPLSREEVAVFIRYAEDMIESYMGLFVAPTWTANELHTYPLYYRREYGKPMPLQNIKFRTNWKQVLTFGQPRLTFIETAVIAYSDEDLDGFEETALITFTTAEELTVDCISHFKFFVPGKDGNDKFEIRPVREFDYDGTNGTVYFDSWVLVDPDKYLPKGFLNKKALNACDSDNYLIEIDVYYEDKDPCLPEVELIWSRDNITQSQANQLCLTCSSTCSCDEIKLPACAKILDDCEGVFVLELKEYDEEGCIDPTSCPCTLCTPPDKIKINYLSGCSTCDNYWSICPEFLKAILALSIADAPTAICGCSCMDELYQYWQRDLTEQIDGIRISFPLELIINNPFGGNKRGHHEAYSILEQLKSNGRFCYKEY